MVKTMKWNKMSPEEIRLMSMWYNKDGKTPSEIARLLRRSKSSVTRHLFIKSAAGKQGRKAILTEKQVDALVTKMKQYVKQAAGRYRVTYDMIRRRSRTVVSTWTLMRLFHARGITFKKFREKPDLTEEDIQDRFDFGKKNRKKRAIWWTTSIDIHVDCKKFPVYLNGKARNHAARARTWGAFRGRGDGLRKPYIRPRKDLKFNTGARGVMILAGVGPKKMMVWEPVRGRWNAKTAAEMYRGPIATALRKARPSKRRFVCLEDNDPSGFKSKKGLRAKAECRIKTFDIPKRSPQLNVLDYAVWSEINTRMRKQERRYPHNKKESRQQYLARLRRTAMRLSPKFLKASIMNLRTRCQRLYDAKGEHIEEGRSA